MFMLTFPCQHRMADVKYIAPDHYYAPDPEAGENQTARSCIKGYAIPAGDHVITNQFARCLSLLPITPSKKQYAHSQ